MSDQQRSPASSPSRLYVDVLVDSVDGWMALRRSRLCAVECHPNSHVITDLRPTIHPTNAVVSHACQSLPV